MDKRIQNNANLLFIIYYKKLKFNNFSNVCQR